MTGNVVHRSILATAAFLGVTAVAGGVGLLSGAVSPDLEQLNGSPFGSYTVPGLVLLGIGLVAFASTVLTYRRHDLGVWLAGIVGALIMAFETVQVMYIDFHMLQSAYFALGTLMLLLAALAKRGSALRTLVRR